MADYYATVRSGERLDEATAHADRECAADGSDVTPRPISQALAESTDPELCPACTGNSSDSASGGDDASDVPAPLGADAADMIENGACPWCSDYDGDHVGRHASSAHPEKWTDYKESNA